MSGRPNPLSRRRAPPLASAASALFFLLLLLPAPAHASMFLICPARSATSTSEPWSYPPGNIAVWSFDTLVSLYTNSANPATNALYMNGGTWTNGGPTGFESGAWVFTATGDHGRVLSLDNAYSESNSWSKLAWCYPYSVTTNGTIWARSTSTADTDGDKAWLIAAGTASNVFLDRIADSYPSPDGVTNAVLTWSYLAVTYDETEQTLTYYKDGVTNGSVASVLLRPVATPARYYLGAWRENTNTAFFSGAITRYLDFAGTCLVASSIANLHTNGLPDVDELTYLRAQYDFLLDVPCYCQSSVGSLVLDPTTTVESEPEFIPPADGVSARFRYNGATSYMTTRSTPCVLGTMSNWTVGAWVCSVGTNTQCVWSQRQEFRGCAVYLLGQSTTNRIRVDGMYGAPINSFYISGENMWTPGTWIKIDVVKESLTNFSFYINGLLEANFGATNLVAADSSAAMCVGVYGPWSMGSFFEGDIDEVYLNTNSLSASEILDNYTRGPGGPNGD